MTASLPALDKNGVRLRYPAILEDEHGQQFRVFAGWLDGAGTNVSAVRLSDGAHRSTTRLNSARYTLVKRVCLNCGAVSGTGATYLCNNDGLVGPHRWEDVA